MTAVLTRMGGDRTASVATMPAVAAKVRAPRWPWWMALFAFVQYTVLGVWLLKVQDYMINDAASRTLTAQTIVLSRDPHLAAMGFYWPPLPMFVRIPFVLLLFPVGQSVLAGAVSTAFISALVIPVLAAIGRELKLTTARSALLIGLYAANPVVMFYAANGMSEACSYLFLAVTYLGYLRYSSSHRTEDLRIVGIGLALGVMSRIEFIGITVAFIVACALLTPRDRWKRMAFLVALPPLFVFLLWTWASELIAKDALYWYHAAKTMSVTPDDHPWMPDHLTVVNIVGYVMEMTLINAPGLGILLLFGLARRTNRRNWFGLVLTGFALPAFVALQLVLKASVGAQRYFVVSILVATVALMWVVSTTARARPAMLGAIYGLAVLAMVGGAIAVIPLNNDRDQSSQQGESAFFGPLIGKKSLPTESYIAGLDGLIRKLDPELAKGEYVAMDSRGGFGLLYSKHPKQFIVPEDRDFEEIMSDAEGRFRYVLMTSSQGLTSQYAGEIRAAMDNAVNGKFVVIGETATVQLWKYEENSNIVPDGPLRPNR
jgi:Dolichyl-phosphate-mannose-protein mannosyltransferase